MSDEEVVGIGEEVAVVLHIAGILLLLDRGTTMDFASVVLPCNNFLDEKTKGKKP